MIPLNYHHLYYFWTITKAGSFTRGSRLLLLSQSALSLQIARLERQLKTRLLERNPKGVSLTAEGQTVFDYCERIFTEGGELAARIARGLNTAPAVLRLGIEESLSGPLLLAVMNFIKREDQRIQVTVCEGDAASLADRLRRHALDIVISPSDESPELGKNFTAALVARIPISFVAVPAVAAHVKKFPSGLGGFPILTRSPGSPIRREVDAYFRRKGISPVIAAEIENSHLLRMLTLQGKGIAAIDTLPMLLDLQAGRLITLNRKPTGLQERVFLLYNSRPKANTELQRVIEAITTRFKLTVRI